jgi:hypothetical protein
VKILLLLLVILVGGIVAAVGFYLLSSWAPRNPEAALVGPKISALPGEPSREVDARHGVDAKDSHGFTALDRAARQGRADAIADLVRAGADPDLRDSGPNGWTPLLHAVHKNELASVQALLATGAAVDGRGENGLTPLMLAAAQGEAEIVEELLAAGANPRLRGSSGWTALERGVANGHPEVVDALLRNDPGLRLGPGPRVWAVRALAWVRGRSELLEQIDRGPEVAGR